jgi:RimJ/RimL family protein N-acetyltransferase
LIRSFSTDSRETRKGYATKSLRALIPFIKSNFEGVEEVVLGVNEKNPNAYQMYLKAGFTDTKKKYLGPRGYQHVLKISC